MGDFQEIAKQFCGFYYQTFDKDRSQLAALYRDNSMLTFEGAPSQGPANIVEKLSGLSFQRIEHVVDSMDAQPSHTPGGIIVIITGKLLVDEEKKKMNYTQTFHLLPDRGTYYVFNDIFRLVYPAE